MNYVHPIDRRFKPTASAGLSPAEQEQLMLDRIEARLAARGLRIKREGEAALVSGFATELDGGGQHSFPLYALQLEDTSDQIFVRLALVPLIEQPSDGYPAPIALAACQLNHELPQLKLAFDEDGDLELLCDIYSDQCQDAQIDRAIDLLVDVAGSYYNDLSTLLLPDIQQLVERFVEEWSDSIDVDFSIESLEQFEAQVDDDYRAFLQKNNYLMPMVQIVGAYIGETLCRVAGGIWQTNIAIEESAVQVFDTSCQVFRMARTFLASAQSLRPSVALRRLISTRIRIG